MLWKTMKLGTLAIAGGAVLGGLVFGSDLVSYVSSSRNEISHAVRDNIPLDFQIRRAKDLLNATEPEMRRNIRLMAEEEVDIAILKSDIARSADSLETEKARLHKLRKELATTQPTFTFGEITYSRDQVVQELSRRLNFYREAETALAQKRELLTNRQKSLAAASEAVERARGQRVLLTAQIEALEGRHRLVRASSSGAEVRFDHSKLAQAEKVVAEVTRQLDIAEHALAREAKFTHPMSVDVVDEKSVLSEVDAHLQGKDLTPQSTAAAIR